MLRAFQAWPSITNFLIKQKGLMCHIYQTAERSMRVNAREMPRLLCAVHLLQRSCCKQVVSSNRAVLCLVFLSCSCSNGWLLTAGVRGFSPCCLDNQKAPRKYRGAPPSPRCHPVGRCVCRSLLSVVVQQNTVSSYICSCSLWS